MSNTLSGTRVRNTFLQLLHLDGGPEATEKPVLSASGVVTALWLGTGSARLGNFRFQGNQVSPVSGQLQLTGVQIVGGTISGIDPLPVASGGTGASAPAAARQALGLGAMATQEPNAVAITGGSVGGTFVGTFSSTVSVAQIADKRYAMFSSLVGQSITANVPTAITFNDSAVFNSGVSLASASEIAPATAGLYSVRLRLALRNAGAADYDATVWIRRGGVDVPASATVVTVPKAADGGAASLSLAFLEQFQANQNLTIMWATEHADLSLGYLAAQTVPFAAPAAPSAVCIVDRIA